MRARATFFVVAATATLMMVVSPAWADTFVVNSTGDDGDVAPAGVCNTEPFPVGTEPVCTLRAAIQTANANNNPAEVDRIDFSIGASGVATIFPGSPLPTITQPVDINGYSVPGASANTTAVGDNADLRIRLDGDTMAGIPNVRTTVEGTLRSIPDETFTLQFFRNPEGNNNEGKTFIGQKSVSTDADGVITFTFRPGQKVRVGNFITATATHASDTSELSAPRLVRNR